MMMPVNLHNIETYWFLMVHYAPDGSLLVPNRESYWFPNGFSIFFQQGYHLFTTWWCQRIGVTAQHVLTENGPVQEGGAHLKCHDHFY